MGRRAKGEGSLIRLRGCRFWYASYYQNGQQVKVSTKKTGKMEALSVLRQLMNQRDNGAASPADLRKIHYGDLRQMLIDDYTARGNKSLETRADGTQTIVGLPQLDGFFGFKPATEEDPAGNPGWPVTRLNSDAARDFARQRQGEGAGPAMINRSLACLRRMLHLAHEFGKIQHVPKIRMLKEPAPRKGFLEPEKFDELLAALPTYLRPLVAFLYWSGVRLGEALQIEWPQVDLDGRLVRLHSEQTKNAEARIIPLAAPVVALLRDVEPKHGLVFDPTNLRQEWAQACEAVGLGSTIKEESKAGNAWTRYNGLLIHDLRRSAVRNLVRAGVHEHVAMKISGHKTASVFRRYNIVSVDDVQGAMQAVETFALGNGHKVKLGKTSLRKPSRSTRKLLQAHKMGA